MSIISPSYYQNLSPEPITVILDWSLSFCTGCAVKYIARAGKKGSATDDLRKAIRYLEYEIARLDREAQAPLGGKDDRK